MTNDIISNGSLKVTIPSIPRIKLNETSVFGGVAINNGENTVIFQIKQANAADWPAQYLLAAGEPGLELDTGKLKIGDGHTFWAELDYVKGKAILNSDDVLEYYDDALLLKGQHEAAAGQIPAKATNGAITWVTPVQQDEVDALAARLTTLENGAILSLASEEDAGAVKSSSGVNKIKVENDGTMTINSVGVNKLINNGYTLILNNGQSI